MTCLIIGLATTDLMRHDLPLDDRGQPWLVDIAAELMAADGRAVDIIKRTVRLPRDTTVKNGAQDIHKISTRSARRSGATQRWACFTLIEMLNEARFAISYSGMTREVISSVITRIAGNDAGQWLSAWQRAGVEWIDLRTPATQICKLPYDPPNALGGYRWPSRAEAAEKVLGAAYGDIASDEMAQNSAAWHNMKTDRWLYIAMCGRGLIEAGEPNREVAA